MMRKIEAIKAVRAATNLGLKESKDLVELIAPLLQMSREDIDRQIDNIEHLISQCPVNRSMAVSEAQLLVKLCEQRDYLVKLRYPDQTY